METYTKLTLARSQAKRYTCWHSHLQKNVWKVMLMPVADPFCRKEANEVFGRTPMPVPITLRGQHELASCLPLHQFHHLHHGFLCSDDDSTVAAALTAEQKA